MKSAELSDFCTGENRPCNQGLAAKGPRYRSSLDWRVLKIFLGLTDTALAKLWKRCA
jgi:hypothetical protein